MKRTIKVDPNKLKKKRLDKGMSQRELERVAGVSRRSIMNYENSECRAEEYTVARLSKALGCKIEDLSA